MKMTRKGFTLVELLIVIVVIGILSAMMMLSSNEAVTTARANNIASNLRNLKTAALAYWADNMNETFTEAGVKAGTFKYLGGKTDIPDSGDYSIKINNTTKQWYVVYHFPKALAGNLDIRRKLQGRAKSLGLLDWSNKNNSVSGSYTKSYDGGVPGEFPAMRIR